DHTQGALEPLHLQATPEVCAVAAALGPLRVQEGQMGVECALPRSEHIRALAATDLANEFATVPVRRTISLSGTASLTSAMIAALVSLRRRYPSYCSRSAQVSSFGLIVV